MQGKPAFFQDIFPKREILMPNQKNANYHRVHGEIYSAIREKRTVLKFYLCDFCGFLNALLQLFDILLL